MIEKQIPLSPYFGTARTPDPPDPPPEPPDDLNFCLGGFGGLESGFGLLCSLGGVFLGGAFFVFVGFFSGFVSIFLGAVFCLTGLLSTFPGSVVGLFAVVFEDKGEVNLVCM